jgi:hypothetical protein
MGTAQWNDDLFRLTTPKAKRAAKDTTAIKLKSSKKVGEPSEWPVEFRVRQFPVPAPGNRQSDLPATIFLSGSDDRPKMG